MTKDEWAKLRAGYDLQLNSTAQPWDKVPLPEGVTPPAITIWRYETRGKHFVIVKYGDDDFQAFKLVDREGLKDYLGDPAIASRKGS